MRQVFIIFKKEFIDTLRDRRSLFRMFIIPLGIFPLIFGVVGAIEKNSTDNEEARELRVGLLAPSVDLGFRDWLEQGAHFTVHEVPHADTMVQWIRDNRLDAGVAIPATFAANVSGMRRDSIFQYGAAASRIVNRRLEAAIGFFQKRLLQSRLDSLGLRLENVEPTGTRFIDTATKRETIGKIMGGFLPYIFIIFCYTGCLFPAIDLFTGEKERSTIETLLSAPIDRGKVLMGKMLMIVVAGLLSAMLSILGLLIAFKTSSGGMSVLGNIALGILSPSSIVALVLMLIPLVVFFAGMLIPATVYAKSFKEAAITLQPFTFVVILPAIVGMIPGIELNGWTATIPILNVVLITKEIIAGTLHVGLLLEAVATLIILAFFAVLLSFRRFGNEKNILRS